MAELFRTGQAKAVVALHTQARRPLTPTPPAHTLAIVLRGVAIVAAVAMLSMSASAALLHVHASAGHEHAEHHHGPAAHSHASVVHHHQHAGAARQDGTEIEPCYPAEHVVPLAFTCVAPGQPDVQLPEALDARALADPKARAVVRAPADVRAHSPPRITGAPLRAPPIAHLA